MGKPDDLRHTAAGDAGPLTREPLAGGPSPERWRVAQRWALRVALALATGGLVAVLARGWLPPLGSASPTPIPNARHASPSTIPAGSGWTRAGPAYAQGIVFAPSAPETAYTCGVPVPTQQDGRGRVVLSVSHDGGTSWLTLETPGREQQTCQLTINPLDARDVVLATSVLAPDGQTLSAASYYRSFDGGQTWHGFPLPSRGAGAPDASFSWWVWVGSNFYMAPYYSEDGAYRRLAVSVGGAALRWLDTKPLFAGLPASARINVLIPAARVLYVQLDRQTPDCSPDCFTLRRTSDGGATWQDYTPQLDGKPLYLLSGFGLHDNNASLFAAYDLSGDRAIQGYARSTDGGATWASLPALPNAELTALDLVQTPSGAIYAAVWSFTDPSSAQLGVYALAPGSKRWRFVAPYSIEQNSSLVVAWDTLGQPAALWGPAAEPHSLGVSLGLMRHAP